MFCKKLFKDMVVDRVEETLNVTFNDSRNTPSGSDFFESSVAAPMRSEPVGRLVEFRF